ncbi:MAG TPA: FtsX-like permease family protein [Blastocatellia bacterium]|nr:FtsX-like permease family protein [Blastocatellia bacterium]
MKSYFKLFRQFILRALAREKMRSVITALGISLGVAVTIAIRLANVSALESFRTATESVAGETSIQITGAAGRFDEMLLADLKWLRQYGEISPVITGYAMTDWQDPNAPRPNDVAGQRDSNSNRAVSNTDPRDRGHYGEFLQVLGVDILRDRALRRYRLIRTADRDREPDARELLLLLADQDSIILTETFARKRGLSIQSRIALTMSDRRHEYTVRGLLADEGPARALQGNFALMDIAAAQLAFNRVGLLDRVDVKLKRGVTVDKSEVEIANRLPSTLVVARPETSYSEVEKMISAFHFNLNALGSIALIVGLFLIYNTISISVITRRDQIGTLRALGVGRLLALALFLGEALLLATAGTVIGLGLGRVMASAAVRATATTVQTFYISSTATQTIAATTLGLNEVLVAFGVALSLSLIAASVPALEAARVRPIEAMRGAERLEKTFKPSLKFLSISLALLATGYLLTRVDAGGGLPVFGYAAALAVMFGGAFLAPNVLWVTCLSAGRIIGLVFRRVRVEARLASANLRSAIPRVSISVAALAVSLAMMVAVSIMIGSFRETVAYWLDQTMVADIYARPMARTAMNFAGEIGEDAIALVKQDPQVAAVDPFANEQVSYEGDSVTVGGGDFATLLKHGRLLYKSPANARERIEGAIGRDAVTVNESFSLRYKKRAGDRIELPTAQGAREFEIAAIFYDYANSRGVAVMDRATFARYFPYAPPSSLSIYLRPGVDAAEVNDRLGREVGSRYQIFFITNGGVRREVMRIFDSTFAITYALEVIAITVAGLGVISTLITLILERRAEIAILGFLGATREQIRRMVVIEALMIGGVSQVIGVIIGLMLSLVLIYVINVQSFGWTIQFHFPLGFIIQSTLLILLATAVAGLYPARRAAMVEAVRFAREE